MHTYPESYCLDVIIYPEEGINPDQVREGLLAFLTTRLIWKQFGLSEGRRGKVPGPKPIKILRIKTTCAQELAEFLILNWKSDTFDGSQCDYKIHLDHTSMARDDDWLDDVDFTSGELPATSDGNTFVVLPSTVQLHAMGVPLPD